jgi:hypothetical protein
MNKAELKYYVSPDGCDEWSGSLCCPSRDKHDGPFASIHKAQQVVRDLDKSVLRAIHIVLRSGTYYLDQPLRLDGGDSGSIDCPVIYEAWPEEQAILSAGMQVGGWKEIKRNGQRTWVTPAPGHVFHNLWVNGRRRFRPRFPKQELLRTVGSMPGSFYDGTNEFHVEPKDVRDFSRPDDVELVYFAVWTESRLPIESIDREKGIIRTRLRSAMNACDVSCSSKYYYDNVFEELDTAGQWYLDRKENTLYYLPFENETLENTQIAISKQVHVVEVAGSKEHPVTYVNFKGLIFQHTEWWWTDQTPIFRWDVRKLEPVAERDVRVVTLADDKAADHQAAISCEASLDFKWAQHCSIDNCTVSNTGSYAIAFGIGCTGNQVNGCLLADHGGGGIKIGTQQVETADSAAGFNIVRDCEIRDCAEVFHSAVGVWIGQSAHNQIVYNAIHDMSYSGISVGWTWGYGPSGAYCNLIEYNEVYNIAINGWMHDLAGIYMLGVSPGTIVRNNLIHDVGKDNNVIGIYTDEASSFIRWENNIVDRADSAYLHHFGRNNVLVNNIFAHYHHGLVCGKDERPEVSLFVERNIFYSNDDKVLLDWQGHDGCVYRNNVYWCPTGNVQFNGKDYGTWRALGQDTNSVMADPLFADPEHGDFTLSPNSPAIAAGFVPFDLSCVGPRARSGAFQTE